MINNTILYSPKICVFLIKVGKFLINLLPKNLMAGVLGILIRSDLGENVSDRSKGFRVLKLEKIKSVVYANLCLVQIPTF